ncbi:MAG: cation:proton antiporter [Candidatus Sericytochromatia bacterium]|nr:cation:proton antiporter [Candidatus Tanganyikabacteria bacterium]
MHDFWLTATAWIALALVASLISIRLGLSIALVEIVLGVVGGNFLGLRAVEWTDFLAGAGAIVLTFLAGAEIDPESLRKDLRATLSIGAASFLFPFLGAGAFAYWVGGWDRDAALIAGIALSTTSVAVVYAVMVETGLNRTPLGKRILTACFITDLGTVVALGLLFARYNANMVVFVAALAVAVAVGPRGFGWAVQKLGKRVSEPEVKLLLLALFGLGALATLARSEAVLPAYVLGLALAGVFQGEPVLMARLRSIAFGILTPFYFLKAGMHVSLPAIAASFWLIVAFLFVKLLAKYLGVAPLTRLLAFDRREGTYTTLLMSTGLTFGSISALFGLTNGYIDREQYTVLVTAVIGSAVLPTLVAQAFFRPAVPAAVPDEAIVAEEA